MTESNITFSYSLNTSEVVRRKPAFFRLHNSINTIVLQPFDWADNNALQTHQPALAQRED